MDAVKDCRCGWQGSSSSNWHAWPGHIIANDTAKGIPPAIPSQLFRSPGKCFKTTSVFRLFLCSFPLNHFPSFFLSSFEPFDCSCSSNCYCNCNCNCTWQRFPLVYHFFPGLGLAFCHCCRSFVACLLHIRE